MEGNDIRYVWTRAYAVRRPAFVIKSILLKKVLSFLNNFTSHEQEP